VTDIYEEMQNSGLAYVQRKLDAEPYIDPWKEIGAGEVQMLLDGVNSGRTMSAVSSSAAASSMSVVSAVSSNQSSRCPSKEAPGEAQEHRDILGRHG